MKSVRDISETAITAVLIFIVLQLATQTFKVDGTSMEPTLSDRQNVLVNKFVYAGARGGAIGDVLRFITGTDDDERAYLFHGPQRDDIIVFVPPTTTNSDTDFVKRVIGIPGDEIDIRGGQVFVNGVLREDGFPATKTMGGSYPVVVGPDEYFVLGDNRRRSNDSRSFRMVPAGNVVGRVWFGYWPPSDVQLYSSGTSFLGLGNLGGLLNLGSLIR